MLQQLAAVILPVVVIAGIGYAWSRLKRPFDNALVTQLVSMIGSPCLVASALTSLHVEPESLGVMALATILVFSGMFVLGFAVLRFMKLPMHSYLPAVVFSNAGNMGLPLALFAFGDSGLALAVVYFAFSATLQFTAGMSIAAGTASVKHLVKMPVIYAVGASFAVIVTGIAVPTFIANTLQILGGLTIPLMLLALGVSLGSLRVRSLPRNLFLSLVRMIGGFAISFLVAWALDLSPMARGVLLIQASMPVAVFNYLFAQYYNRRPEDVAAMVIISTLLSFGTLPFLIYYVLATAQ
ncbi:AEC family transporter [Dongia sp. agr-C8]